jgi:hypothetical protein
MKRLFVLVMLALAPFPAWAVEVQKACDIAMLRHYPMREALKRKAARLTMPEIFFADPTERKKPWEPADDAARRDALARGLATFPADERPVLLLAALSDWTMGDKPMLNFFVLSAGAHYDRVIETLDAFGLTEHAALFREGRALFGPDYGTTDQRYDRWSDGHGTIRDLVLDAHLASLSARFRALRDPIDIAADKVAQSPTLTTVFEPLRRSASDDDRLSFLTSGLWACVDAYGPTEGVLARLATLPDAHRHIIVASIFQEEMLNGSVEQFFYNSSGALAPEVLEALTAMGLPKHAAAVQKGIDLFIKPYPRDTELRRAMMEVVRPLISDPLNALTAEVDDGEIQVGMIRMARAAGIMPE